MSIMPLESLALVVVLAAIFLCVLVKAAPRKNRFVASHVSGRTFEKPVVAVQVLPGFFRDLVDASAVGAQLSRSREDTSAYESLSDAIAEGKQVRSFLLRNVVPQHHFFVFCETVEAALTACFDILDPLGALNSRVNGIDHSKDEKQAEKRQDDDDRDEGNSNVLAVTVCVVRDREGLKRAFGNEEHRRATEGRYYYCRVDGSELDSLEGKLRDDVPRHQISVASIRPEGQPVEKSA